MNGDTSMSARAVMRKFGLAPAMLGSTSLPRVEAMAEELVRVASEMVELREQLKLFLENADLVRRVGKIEVSS